MTTILDKICADKLDHIRIKEGQIPLSDLQKIAEENKITPCFISRLKGSKSGLIAEVKKGSPSKGVIRDNFDPVEIAKIYEDAGAACLSVLTDIPYFQGHDDYLKAIRAQTALPLLRKDFMLTPYQIYESRALGADCILIIMAALEDPQAKDLYDLSTELGMDVLVEVHDESELERALALSPRMIGVNNRNLKTLDVSLDTGLALAEKIPNDILKVAESGISTPQDIARFRAAGFDAFLIGEHFMHQTDIKTAVFNLFPLGT